MPAITVQTSMIRHQRTLCSQQDKEELKMGVLLVDPSCQEHNEQKSVGSKENAIQTDAC